jgi:hypothetical protein
VINIDDYKAWLITKGVADPIWLGSTNQQEDPTNGYTIWETGTLGTRLGRVTDLPTVQVLTRGSSGKVCYQKAKLIDDIMLNTLPPVTIGGKTVVDMGKVSGPVNLGTDERDRTEFSANYWLEIER